MATIAASRIGSVIPWPVTIVIGNAKKLEEVRAILSSALFLFRSLKLDCTFSLSLASIFSIFCVLV